MPYEDDSDDFRLISSRLSRLEETDPNFHKYGVVKDIVWFLQQATGDVLDRATQQPDGGPNSESRADVFRDERSLARSLMQTSEFQRAKEDILRKIRESTDGWMQNAEVPNPEAHQCTVDPFRSIYENLSFETQQGIATLYSPRTAMAMSDFHELRFNQAHRLPEDGDSTDSASDGVISSFSLSQLPPYSELVSISKRLRDVDVDVRRTAMEELDQFPPGDIVCTQHWKRLRAALRVTLGDSDSSIASAALRLHSMLFKNAESVGQGEVFINLVEHLLHAPHLKAPPTGLDLEEEDAQAVLKQYRLLTRFTHAMPEQWINMPDRLSAQVFGLTCRLLSMSYTSPDGKVHDKAGRWLTPGHCLGIVDMTASWLYRWVSGRRQRNLLLHHAQEAKLLPQLVAVCADAPTSVHSAPEKYLSLSECDSLRFIHALAVLSQLLPFSETCDLFPVNYNQIASKGEKEMTLERMIRLLVSFLHVDDAVVHDPCRAALCSVSILQIVDLNVKYRSLLLQPSVLQKLLTPLLSYFVSIIGGSVPARANDISACVAAETLSRLAGVPELFEMMVGFARNHVLSSNSSASTSQTPPVGTNSNVFLWPYRVLLPSFGHVTSEPALALSSLAKPVDATHFVFVFCAAALGHPDVSVLPIRSPGSHFFTSTRACKNNGGQSNVPDTVVAKVLSFVERMVHKPIGLDLAIAYMLPSLIAALSKRLGNVGDGRVHAIKENKSRDKKASGEGKAGDLIRNCGNKKPFSRRISHVVELPELRRCARRCLLGFCSTMRGVRFLSTIPFPAPAHAVPSSRTTAGSTSGTSGASGSVANGAHTAAAAVAAATSGVGTGSPVPSRRAISAGSTQTSVFDICAQVLAEDWRGLAKLRGPSNRCRRCKTVHPPNTLYSRLEELLVGFSPPPSGEKALLYYRAITAGCTRVGARALVSSGIATTILRGVWDFLEREEDLAETLFRSPAEYESSYVSLLWQALALLATPELVFAVLENEDTFSTISALIDELALVNAPCARTSLWHFDDAHHVGLLLLASLTSSLVTTPLLLARFPHMRTVLSKLQEPLEAITLNSDAPQHKNIAEGDGNRPSSTESQSRCESTADDTRGGTKVSFSRVRVPTVVDPNSMLRYRILMQTMCIGGPSERSRLPAVWKEQHLGPVSPTTADETAFSISVEGFGSSGESEDAIPAGIANAVAALLDADMPFLDRYSHGPVTPSVKASSSTKKSDEGVIASASTMETPPSMDNNDLISSNQQPQSSQSLPNLKDPATSNTNAEVGITPEVKRAFAWLREASGVLHQLAAHPSTIVHYAWPLIDTALHALLAVVIGGVPEEDSGWPQPQALGSTHSSRPLVSTGVLIGSGTEEKDVAPGASNVVAPGAGGGLTDRSAVSSSSGAGSAASATTSGGRKGWSADDEEDSDEDSLLPWLAKLTGTYGAHIGASPGCNAVALARQCSSLLQRLYGPLPQLELAGNEIEEGATDTVASRKETQTSVSKATTPAHSDFFAATIFLATGGDVQRADRWLRRLDRLHACPVLWRVRAFASSCSSQNGIPSGTPRSTVTNCVLSGGAAGVAPVGATTATAVNSATASTSGSNVCAEAGEAASEGLTSVSQGTTMATGCNHGEDADSSLGASPLPSPTLTVSSLGIGGGISHAVVGLAEMIIQVEFPSVSNTFVRENYPISALLLRWTTQSFWNIVDWQSLIFRVLASLIDGVDSEVYFLVAAVEQWENDFRKWASAGELIANTVMNCMDRLDLQRANTTMRRLRESYRKYVLSELRDALRDREALVET
eukprot:Rmarinus@m.20704